jgi:hypothetical protein
MSDEWNNAKVQPATASLDAALRRMAHAPIPEGLEERVKARLASAPRNAKLLAWPLQFNSDWLRTAAAAAIVVVVAGGGWGVYSRVVRPVENYAIAAPIRALWTGPALPGGGPGGGMSSAGAMRVPLTLNGTTVNHSGKKHPSRLKSKIQPAAKQPSTP